MAAKSDEGHRFKTDAGPGAAPAKEIKIPEAAFADGEIPADAQAACVMFSQYYGAEECFRAHLRQRGAEGYGADFTYTLAADKLLALTGQGDKTIVSFSGKKELGWRGKIGQRAVKSELERLADKRPYDLAVAKVHAVISADSEVVGHPWFKGF
jgi:hypothetical protein